MDYNFNQAYPVNVNRFIQYESKTKTVSGLPRNSFNVLKQEEMLAYSLCRHFKSLGPKSKLFPTIATAATLTQIAAYFNSINRFEEARLYAKAAVSSSPKNHIMAGIATNQYLYSIAGLQTNASGGPNTTILSIYRDMTIVGQWHYGIENLILMAFHDNMSSISHKSKDPKKALEYHQISLAISQKALGRSHVTTAGYLTRAGCYLYNLGRVDDALAYLTQSAEIYTSLQASPYLIAEVHFYFADCLYDRGDFDGAIMHAQKCRKIREGIYGLSDIRVMDSCRQTAKMVLAPFKDYQGVITPLIKITYREAIQCHEKVFRFLQSQSGGKLNKRKTLIRRQSMRNPDQPEFLSLALGTGSSRPICGPLVKSPYGWTPPLNSSLLHKLTKDIVALKLGLIESPDLKECVRQLRLGSDTYGIDLFDADEARSAILRMAAVSPSVYLDDIFLRINEKDDTAIAELGLVMQLTERDTLGVSA